MPNQKALKPPSWLPKPFRKPMLDILMTQTILDYYNSLEPHKISEEEHEALSYIRKEGMCLGFKIYDNSHATQVGEGIK